MKADSEQTAYITPTSVSGSYRIWAAVYNKAKTTQFSVDVGITQASKNVRLKSGYMADHRGVAGTTYALVGGDSEWEVTTSNFEVKGRWTP